MAPRSPYRIAPEPPPTLMAALCTRVAESDLAAFGAMFALRTAAQQVDNAITEWMADSAGTPARFQVLGLIWAAGAGGMPHKEIVQALQVTRATVSGLMAGLERDGLVESAVDPDDRRNLIAQVTPRGRAVFETAIDSNLAALRAAFATLSADEQATLTSLLQRVRQGFVAVRKNRCDQG